MQRPGGGLRSQVQDASVFPAPAALGPGMCGSMPEAAAPSAGRLPLTGTGRAVCARLALLLPVGP